MSEQDFLSILRRELQPIREDIHELRVDVGELKADVSGLKEDVSELKEDVGELKADVNGLKADVSGLKGDVSSLKEEMLDTKMRLGKLEEKTDFMNRKIISMKQELRELKVSNEHVHNEMKHEIARLKDAQDTIITVLSHKKILPIIITT